VAAWGCVLLGYLLVMGPWYGRNLAVFGSAFPPGASHLLWMTDYDQIFSLTPQQYTLTSLLAAGWKVILAARASALWQNLTTALVAQGAIILVPFILLGAWNLRSSLQVRFGAISWLAVFLSESLLFPYASVSGGFFHAGAALQPLWLALAPLGLELALSRLAGGRLQLARLAPLGQTLLLVIMVFLSGMLVKVRVLDSGWNEGEYVYQKAEQLLLQDGAAAADVVVVRNPPAYFIMTGRSAIVIPDGGVSELLSAARQFGVRFLVLELPSSSSPLLGLYRSPQNYPQFTFLGEVDDAEVLRINPSP
jgi:hypothetical protein